MTKGVRCGVALLVFVLGAAACGRSALEPAAAPAEPLRVATSGDYAPFTTLRDGVPAGMDVEVAERVGRDLRLPVELVHVAWPDLVAATQRGDFDVAMGGITMRADRALAGRYTRPYATVGAVALIRSGDTRRFAGAADLDRPGVRIAVNAGGHLEHVARAAFPHAAVEPVADNRAVPQRLLDGHADAAVTDTAEVRDWLGPGLQMVGPFSHDHKAYLLPAANDALAARLDAWLVAREADGWLDAERVRWMGPQAHMDPATATREAVAALVGLRLDPMPSVAAAKRAAGQPIEDRAQEARVIERVRSLSATPDRTAAVYGQLIEMAKTVQQNAPPPAQSASLAELRDAITRVDAQLVRELDRLPPTSTEVWHTALQRSVTTPGVSDEDLNHLAEVLVHP